MSVSKRGPVVFPASVCREVRLLLADVILGRMPALKKLGEDLTKCVPRHGRRGLLGSNTVGETRSAAGP